MRAVAGTLVCISVLFAFQQPFHQFPGVEYFDFETPADCREPTEWAFARLMFPPGPNDGYRGRFDGPWQHGLSLWTQDYPRADRHLAYAVRRLTRIHARSVEQPINPDEKDLFEFPWLYAVQVGEWGLTQKQAQALREYLLRGGFFLADDFHGAYEWDMFEQRIRMAFPDRAIEEIPDDDPIFHVLYDFVDRPQIPGRAHLRLGYKNDGRGAHWRAIRDDKGRIMVLITFNSDLGDAWEYSDDPSYPERFTTAATRIGINSLIYSMTH